MSIVMPTEGFFMHNLTEISLIENYDGIHSREIILGYVAEEPFCVLTEMLTKYYISRYNEEEIFPVGYFSSKYTLGIRNVGSRYELDNFTKHAYHDLCRFIKYKTRLKAAEVGIVEDIDNEYTNLLVHSSSNGNRDIELAIKYSEIIQDVNKGEQDFENTRDYNRRIHKYFMNIDSNSLENDDRDCFFLIQAYVFKRIAEIINTD